MASIARFVLAHKRMVVIFWLVLRSPASAPPDRLRRRSRQKFSVPGKEG